MITFFFGLILGALLGVVTDRLWQRVERRPRFNIKATYYEDLRPAPVKGIGYKITNVGPHEVPDYEIVLFQPLRGSLLAFGCEQSGPQIPREIREHRYVLLKQGAPIESRAWFFQEKHEPVEQVTFEGFGFRLVMKNSDRILFESERIGNTLAKVIVRILETAGARLWTWEEGLAMSTPPRWPERVKRLIREKGTRFITSPRGAHSGAQRRPDDSQPRS